MGATRRGLGTAKKKRNNETSRQVEISDALKTKIGSRPVRAAMIPTATWLPPQYGKRMVLKFRLGTYVTPRRAGLFCRVEVGWGRVGRAWHLFDSVMNSPLKSVRIFGKVTLPHFSGPKANIFINTCRHRLGLYVMKYVKENQTPSNCVWGIGCLFSKFSVTV